MFGKIIRMLSEMSEPSVHHHHKKENFDHTPLIWVSKFDGDPVITTERREYDTTNCESVRIHNRYFGLKAKMFRNPQGLYAIIIFTGLLKGKYSLSRSDAKDFMVMSKDDTVNKWLREDFDRNDPEAFRISYEEESRRRIDEMYDIIEWSMTGSM